MMRIEIVANHSVEENLFEAFQDEGVGKHYTKYPNVLGVGSKGPRMGDSIWPEENFAIVIWCEEAEFQGIERAVAAVKKQFPDEGIKLFKPPEPQVIYTMSGAAPALSPPAVMPPEGSLLATPPVYQPYGPEEENS